MARNLDHLVITIPPEASQFTSTQQGGPEVRLPPRVRNIHGSVLQQKLANAWKEAEKELIITYVSTREGAYLEFKGEENYELAVKSLEDLKSKQIRLLNVRDKDNTEYATVFVANSKKEFFFDKIESYIKKDRADTGKPHNQKLIESISEIRKALAIESFWMDSTDLIPKDAPEWCEIWLRDSGNGVLGNFETLLTSLNIQFKNRALLFPERIVKLVKLNRYQLEQLSIQSDDIAEYRKAKETALFHIDQENIDQADWVKDLLSRRHLSEEQNIAVCILDTGVNNGHPMITDLLADGNCQSVVESWGQTDHNKHGTLMAGLCAYGNIQKILEDSSTFSQTHRLESVKILPPIGETDPELWGDITQQGVHLAEIESPETVRIICMAVTSNDIRDEGYPSSWSAAIDQISSGALDMKQRLFVVSAGNPPFNENNYPEVQILSSVQDPAQSWNAITVGAYTNLDQITAPELNEYNPVAPAGSISPFTTTSSLWHKQWPIKPEILMEGGNLAIDSSGFFSVCDDLSLVSTFYKPHESHFYPFSMTSASAAQASWFLAKIQSKYPDYWPETLRALIIHSAEWTDAMIKQFDVDFDYKSSVEKLIRSCGYGVPNLDRALLCASNSLTLVAQNSIQPYDRKFKEERGRKKPVGYKTNEMHLYELPWPKEVLEELPAETEVEMRVTLSYFIEPGPGEIGWGDRYRYPSHLLRFDINSPGEDKDDFVNRINAAEREPDEKTSTSSAASFWTIGQARDKGSIHSDIWKGYASELATSNLVAVYPRIGWWRERAYLEKWNSSTRYSLIISIETPETNLETNVPIDIYSPVENMIRIQTEIEI